MAFLIHNHHDHQYHQVGGVSRSSSFDSYGYGDNNGGFNMDHHNNTSMSTSMRMIEKRQVFLRSYQFSRKKSLSDKIRTSLRRAKRVIWLRLRSARRIRKLVLSRLVRWRWRWRWSLCSARRRRFAPLLNHNNRCSSSCFW